LLGIKILLCKPRDPEARAWSSGPAANWRRRSCSGACTWDYSVHPLAVSRRIEVAAHPGQVLVSCDGVEVARHAGSWARHHTITDPDHTAVAAAAAARKTSAAKKPAPDVTEVEGRSLETYDRILGVIDDGLSTGEGPAR
jgi:hypothetical protein